MVKVDIDNIENWSRNEWQDFARAWDNEHTAKWNCSLDELNAMMVAARNPVICMAIIDCEKNGTNPVDLMGFRIAKDIDTDSTGMVE